MPPARALALLEPVLSALAAAHRAGLIHRDVKPENVLIATDPNPGEPGQGRRLRPGQGGQRRHPAHRHRRRPDRHRLLPRPRARRRRPRRRARRRLRRRRGALRAAHRAASRTRARRPIQVAYKHVHEDVPPPSAAVPGHPGVRRRAGRPGHRPRPRSCAPPTPVCCCTRCTGSSTLSPGRPRRPRAGPPTSPPLPAAARPSGRPRSDTDPTRSTPTSSPPCWRRPTRLRSTRGDELIPPLTRLRRHQPPVRHRRPAVPRPPIRTRGSRCCWSLLLVLAPAAAGAGRLVVRLGPLHLHTRRPRPGQAAAVEKLDAAGLETEMGERTYSETVPAGRVLQTDPTPASASWTAAPSPW